MIDNAADFHIRNGSNNNRFEGNVIESSFTTALVTEWEDVGESSSCGTEIVDNVWRGNYYCDRYTAAFENNGASSSCKKFSAKDNRFGDVPDDCRR